MTLASALLSVSSAIPARCPAGSPWRWSIATVEDVGRIVLPAHAREALRLASGHTEEVRGRCRRAALTLRRSGGDGGVGAPVAIDGRGRLSLPVWLRQATTASGSVLVGTCADPVFVIVAPVGVLDGIGRLFVGDGR